VFSRRFVKSFPVLSTLRIETELSVHALELALPGRGDRDAVLCEPEGSVSKLNLARRFSDPRTILKLYRSEKPLRFFTAIGVFLALVSVGLAIRSSSLPRGRPGAAAADRGAVDGPDDRGDPVGVVGTGAGYRDARPAAR